MQETLAPLSSPQLSQDTSTPKAIPGSVRLGVFGFGCVGQGLHKVLGQTHGIKADIRRIGIKNAEKPRPLGPQLFTTDPNDILSDPEIDVVVELIDDAQAALTLVREALKGGKSVVSANKKMIAENLEALLALQEQHQGSLLYEGACCASIPIIRNLEEYYDNDLLTSVTGIFNGSTNYILTKVFQEGQSFSDALQEAQEKGFAETDPSLDLEGWDPKYKLVIILLHAFGLLVKPEQVFHFGIDRINAFDVDFAKQRGASIKLVAHCERRHQDVVAFVLPRLISPDSHLANVAYEYNGVVLQSAFSESQLFVGKGAGDQPTGSAVLSDVSALRYHYRYEYRKLQQDRDLQLSQEYSLTVYVRFPVDKRIPEDDFGQIFERYQSSEYQYVIGAISLSKLSKAPWVSDPKVNLLQV